CARPSYFGDLYWYFDVW
nr:immunoglobulin heavy chain junction region [Mus musculus]